MGKPAALDVSVTSPLNPLIIMEVGVTAGAAAQATELRKHKANNPKCVQLGWECIPIVVESYGAWETEASALLSAVVSRLAITSNKPKSVVLKDIYGQLS